MSIKGLENLDGIPLDGLEFCARAYAVFDAIRNAPGGVSELRLRSTTCAKRLMEEILPIAFYTQSLHGPAMRLTVTWHGGNQNYDAFIQCGGIKPTHGGVRKRYYLEVTTSGHPNDYLVRENLDRTGGSFGPRETKRDPKTKKIVSVPSVYSYGECESEVVKFVEKEIGKKRRTRNKPYPPNTILLVQCTIFSIVEDGEWGAIVNQLNGRNYSPFKEVYLLEPNGRRLSRIHNSPIRPRRPTSFSTGTSSHEDSLLQGH